MASATFVACRMKLSTNFHMSSHHYMYDDDVPDIVE